MHNVLLLVARDNRYMYMAHVCCYVCCCDCVGVSGNIVCVVGIVEVCYMFVMDVVFSV